MKKLYNLFIIILLSYSGSDLFALDEPFIRLSDVPSQNPLSLSNKNWDSTLNATYHAPNNEIYVLFDNHIYKFDFEQRLWSEYATVDLPHDVVKFAFSEFHNGFLFWDNGVGRVFLLDSSKQLSRIDNSFEHRNQFSHGPWIDQRTGSIFAFGGYGLFVTKSIITKFENQSREWQLVPVKDPLTIPSPQAGMYIVPDIDNERIFMIGYESLHTVVYNSDKSNWNRKIWKFNLKSWNWSKLKDIPTFSSFTDLSNTYLSMHSTLDFFLYKSNDSESNQSIEAYHVPSNSLKSLPDLAANFKLPHPIIYMVWSESDQLFYVLMAEILSNQNSIQMRVKKIEILDEERFISWLSASDQNYNLWIVGLLVAFASLTLLSVKKTKKRSSIQSEQFKDPKVYITCDKSGGLIELKYQEVKIPLIPVMEQKLLELLLQDFSFPNKYTPSDIVDAHLQPNHPSVDYIRRNRNLTLERLESLFQSLYELENDKYILRGVNQFDKRKSEYRLNHQYIEVEIATNLLHS